ncbi:MAG: adenylyltransferase/cytidyltransferase family protein [Patescibacteria group bacterium]
MKIKFAYIFLFAVIFASLHLIFLKTKFYGDRGWVDLPLHFAMGLFFGAIFLWRRGRPSVGGLLLFGFAGGLIWEIVEFSLWNFLPEIGDYVEIKKTPVRDIFSDLSLDVLGSLAWLFFAKIKPMRKRNEIVVAVSGGFDPIHVGHARMFKEARKLGDKLVVILNNDNWLQKKKGHAFMPQEERAELIGHIKWVDEVIITNHAPMTEDMSVCEELRALRPHIFANGGDRFADNIPEVVLCRELGIETIFNVGDGGKIQSSSWLLESYLKKSKRQ